MTFAHWNTLLKMVQGRKPPPPSPKRIEDNFFSFSFGWSARVVHNNIRLLSVLKIPANIDIFDTFISIFFILSNILNNEDQLGKQ